MSDYSISEAKNNLPQLIRQAEAGCEVRMTRRGAPVAFLVSARRYEELTAARTGFAERYRSFRQTFESEPELHEALSGLRDPSPGREFSW